MHTNVTLEVVSALKILSTAFYITFEAPLDAKVLIPAALSNRSWNWSCISWGWIHGRTYSLSNLNEPCQLCKNIWLVVQYVEAWEHLQVRAWELPFDYSVIELERVEVRRLFPREMAVGPDRLRE